VNKRVFLCAINSRTYRHSCCAADLSLKRSNLQNLVSRTLEAQKNLAILAFDSLGYRYESVSDGFIARARTRQLVSFLKERSILCVLDDTIIHGLRPQSRRDNLRSRLCRYFMKAMMAMVYISSRVVQSSSKNDSDSTPMHINWANVLAKCSRTW